MKKMEVVDFHEELQLKKYTLYKYELAKLYNVDVKTMVAWMNLFIDKLVALGYKKSQRKLTPKMTRCIIDHLGEP